MTQARATSRGAQGPWTDRLAGTDRVTGLPNRWAFSGQVGDVCSTQEPSTVIVISVNGANTIRSRDGGHEADALLQRAARTIMRSVRGCDFVARTSDDGFGIVLAGTELPHALRIARRICHEAERGNIHLAPHQPPLFLTFGAASGRGCDPDALVVAADPHKANRAPDPAPVLTGISPDPLGPYVA